MKPRVKFVFCFRNVVVLAAVAALTGLMFESQAADRGRAADDVPADEVEMFAAMESGELEVRFIPKDATTANVLFENKTDRPLAIKLPEAFAGVPVLAQFGGEGGGGGFGGGGGGLGGGGGGGGGQGVGGGLGGGGGGFGGGGGGGFGGGGGGFGGGGGGFFRVAPDRVRKLKVACVCLEHGKPDPNPRMKYEIKPIETFTQDERVIELCKMVGRSEVPRNAAQAAVWHLIDRMSWEELATKNRVELRTLNYYERYFSPQDLGLAVRIVAEAQRRAEGSDNNLNRPDRNPGSLPSYLQAQRPRGR